MIYYKYRNEVKEVSEKLELSIKGPEGEVTISVPAEEYVGLDRVLSLIPNLLVGYGWMPGSFPNALGEFLEWVECHEEGEK